MTSLSRMLISTVSTENESFASTTFVILRIRLVISLRVQIPLVKGFSVPKAINKDYLDP